MFKLLGLHELEVSMQLLSDYLTSFSSSPIISSCLITVS